MSRRKKKQKDESIQNTRGIPTVPYNTTSMVNSMRSDVTPQNISDPLGFGLLKSRYPEMTDIEIAQLVNILNPAQTVYTDEDTSQFYTVRRAHKKDTGRLEDEELLSIAQQDPDVASIVSTRVAQMTVFAQPANSLFDRGLKLIDKDKLDRNDFDSEESFINEMKRRDKEKDQILNWFLTCGENNKETLDGAFAHKGAWNKKFTLKDYIQCQTRNLLVIGRMARENIWGIDENTGEKILVLFRALPVEQIKPALRKGSNPVTIDDKDKGNTYSQKKADEYNEESEEFRDAAYIQDVRGRAVAFYKEDEITVRFYQRQSNFNFQFYPVGPIEQAVATIYLNHCVNKHLINKFQTGTLAKSMLVIRPRSTSEGANTTPISRKEIKALQTGLTQMGRVENSNLVPILSGDIDVQHIDMNAKTDNEWLDLRNNNKRALLASFQCDAKEVGWGQLGDTAALGQGNNGEEWSQGEERGLRILGDIILEDLNELKNIKFGQMGNRYTLDIQGIGSESREIALQRMEAEQNLTASLNDLLSKSDQNAQIEIGGNMPLNPLWHQNIVRFMKMGEVRKYFFGDKNAENNKDLDFYVDPAIDQLRVARRTEEITVETQKVQLQIMKMQVSQGGQQPQQGQDRQPQQGQDPNAELKDQQGQQEPELKDTVQKSIALWKSMNYTK